MDKLQPSRRVEYVPPSYELGTLRSGEKVFGDLDNDPDINIPDNDLAKAAGYTKAKLVEEALSWLYVENEGLDGEYIVWEHRFDEFIGVGGCLETEPGDDIIRAIRRSKRTKRTLPTNFVIGKEGVPTQYVTFILQRQEQDPNIISVIAAYTGPKTKPEPVGGSKYERANKKWWQKRALPLRSVDQVDTTTQLPTLNGRLMSEDEFEKKVEETERELLVEKTIEHIRSGEFGPRYIEMAKAPESQGRLWVDEVANHETAEIVEKEIRAFAFLCLVKQLHGGPGAFDQWHHLIPGNIRAVKPDEWRKLVKVARSCLRNYLTKEVYLPKVKAGYEYKLAYQRVEDNENKAEAKATQEVDDLVKELNLKQNDPAFIKAACLWTSAPDSDRNIGRSGRGFSGGLVHFFEYRSGVEKRERFKTIKEPMSVSGFIAFTKRLKKELDLAEELLQDPTLPSNNDVVVLGDTSENRRYYILQPDGELIIAYQKRHQAPQLSTVITGCSIEYVKSVAKASIEKKDKKVRMNKLGPENIKPLLTKYLAI